MTPRLIRLRFWQKLAQSIPANLPTAQVTKNQPVSGTPPTFIASEWYPSIIIGWQSKNVPWINGLTSLINTALFYTSNGQIHIPWMRAQNFFFQLDQIPSVDLRNLMNFTKLMYNQIFTNLGYSYQQSLTPQQITAKVNILRNSPFLLNLSLTNPSSQLASKIGGNLRQFIVNYLLQIK